MRLCRLSLKYSKTLRNSRGCNLSSEKRTFICGLCSSAVRRDVGDFRVATRLRTKSYKSFSLGDLVHVRTSELSSGKPSLLRTSTNFRLDIPSSAMSRTHSALLKGTKKCFKTAWVLSWHVKAHELCEASPWVVLVAGKRHHLDSGERSLLMTGFDSSLLPSVLTEFLHVSCRNLQTLFIQRRFGKMVSGLPGHHSTKWSSQKKFGGRVSWR